MKRSLALFSLMIVFTIPLMADGRRVPVIPVEFADLHFQDGGSGLIVSAQASTAGYYFSSQLPSMGTFTFEVLPIVKLPQKLSYYGANSTSVKDLHIDEAIKDACLKAGARLAPFDCDSDGFVDNVCIVMAGGSEAAGHGADCIWPMQALLSERSGILNVGGVRINSVSISTERSGASVLCHEYAHSLGLQDMYDTDGNLSGGQSKGLWGLSIMENTGKLLCLNAIELEQLGEGNALEVREGHYRLGAIGRNREYLRLETDNHGEYFLLECRDNSSWDDDLGGSGLVVYHIDRTAGDSWFSDVYKRNLNASERWELNQVNCRPDHPCARVIEAVPGTTEVSEVFFPRPGLDAFSSGTQPAFRYWDGTSSPYAVCNITRSTGGSVEFDLVTPFSEIECSPFQDAAIISWKASEVLDIQECMLDVQSEEKPGMKWNLIIPRRDSGVYSGIVEGLVPQSGYTAVLTIICSNGTRFTNTLSFTTKAVLGSLPFIYLNNVPRNPDGTFIKGGRLPLRIYNLGDAAGVLWTFDGQTIQRDDDGLWTPERSGILRAEIEYPDGSREVICKTLNVK